MAFAAFRGITLDFDKRKATKTLPDNATTRRDATAPKTRVEASLKTWTLTSRAPIVSSTFHHRGIGQFASRGIDDAHIKNSLRI